MTTQNKSSELRNLQARYDRLRKKLARLGPILVGTITERTILRKDPDRPGEKKAYGPYYQWTFKEAGKTVTVNLSSSQVKDFQKAIDRNRFLEQTTEEMRRVSRQILDASTVGVKRRKNANSD
jgi:uncharacterized iron-regulated protein